MTQKYNKVTWQDETTSQQGTLINAERLDQMQTAHHYADGFEEVDTVPTEDPDVDYHKVVFCTADTTFYRWDGTQWTKDIDDDTKALLLAHEADHNNPHVVTKAQVGLGNCDNTSDLDKPVSTAQQTALDDKVTIIPVTSGVKFYAQSSGGTSLYQGTSSPVTGITSVPMRDSSGRIKTAAPSANDDTANKKYVDDADALKVNTAAIVSAWQGTPDDDHIPSEKLTKDSLDDKLDDSQLKTAWTSPVSDSNIPSEKLVKDSLDLKINTSALVSAWQVTPDDAHIPSEKLVKTYIDTSLTDGSVTKIGTANVGTDTKPIKLVAGVPTVVTNDLVSTSGNQTISGIKTFDTASFPIKSANDKYIRFNDGNNVSQCWIVGKNDGTIDITVKSGAYARLFNQRAYNSSNVNDIATINTLDNYTPMVRTTGNQTINGIKSFNSLEETGLINRKAVNIPVVSGSLGRWHLAYTFSGSNNHTTIGTFLLTMGINLSLFNVQFYGWGYAPLLQTIGILGSDNIAIAYSNNVGYVFIMNNGGGISNRSMVSRLAESYDGQPADRFTPQAPGYWVLDEVNQTFTESNEGTVIQYTQLTKAA